MKSQAILIALIIVVSISLSGATLSESEIPHQEKEITSEESFIKDFSAVLAEKAVEVAGGIGNLTAQASSKIAGSGSYLIGETIGFFEELGSKAVETSELKAEPVSSDYDSGKQSSLLSSQTKINYSAISCDTESFRIKSKAALIKYLDFNYNRDILNLNTDERWPIASITKLMTSVIAVETLGLESKVIVSDNAVATEGVAGDFSAGEIYSVRDLVKAMLITSSNDAAVALSETVGEKEFIDRMQKKARELKMLQTTYLEPTGLSFVNQSTANDLARLVTYINENYSELFKISRLREGQITDLKSGKTKTMVNINKFAGDDDFLGGKTGYIDESGRNLMALFNVDGRKVLIITLGSDDSFTEADKLKAIVESCR